MISIQSSLTELERSHQLRSEILDCYLLAIKNIAHYAVELDEEITSPHRKYLKDLAAEVGGDKPEALLASRATLRGLLRDYRDRAAQYLGRLRDELSGTARALEEILDTLSQSDGEHEVTLRCALMKLREAAALPSGGAIAPLVSAAANTIEQSVEQLRKQHQLTISQFMVEIRMLHKRIDALEAAAATDECTRFGNREETIERIRSTPAGTYSLFLIGVRGLRRAEVQFGKEVGEELAGAFAKRLRNSLPPTSTFGRWGPEEFVVMLSMKKSEAMASGKWVTEHLSGSYACLKDGKTVRPALQLSVGVVDTVANEKPERILERIGVFLVSQS
uniref:Diguanylate cyclase n=1 Tax=Solibacter usitatus (strain Ellin6076) TaxID=234267 RepID=Q02CD4_SOLUE